MPVKKNPLEDTIGNLGGVESTGDDILNEADAAVETVDHGKTGLLNTKILTQSERRKQMAGEAKIDRDVVTGIGQNLLEKAEIRKGWIPVDRSLLGERDVFYPESWEFYVRPATVEAIKAWSTIDENEPRSVDTVFNEILKACLSIRDTATDMPLPWSSINSWDRFFFVLLVRDYTFSKGEGKIEFEETCDSCDAPVKFTLNTTSLYYDMPDPEVMPHYDRERRAWVIEPAEYGLDKEGVIELYLPTVDKDATLLEYLDAQRQAGVKITNDFLIFYKYLVWLLPKAPKDPTLLKKKIREAELKFKGWNTEEFMFIDDVVRNITVMPSSKLITRCPSCGEEATAAIRFPDGIHALFAVQNRFKKFGSK